MLQAKTAFSENRRAILYSIYQINQYGKEPLFVQCIQSNPIHLALDLTCINSRCKRVFYSLPLSNQINIGSTDGAGAGAVPGVCFML